MTLITAYQSQDKITIIADRLVTNIDGLKVRTECKITVVKDQTLGKITIYAFAGAHMLHRQFIEFSNSEAINNTGSCTLSKLIGSFYKHLKDDLLIETEDCKLTGICIYNGELYYISDTYIAKCIEDAAYSVGCHTVMANVKFKDELSTGQTIKEALTKTMQHIIKHSIYVGGGYDILEYDIKTKQYTLTSYPD